MTTEVFAQLARDAFRTHVYRNPVEGDAEDSKWLQGYVQALTDATADRETQTPGLIALLLHMLDDRRRKIDRFKRGVMSR